MRQEIKIFFLVMISKCYQLESEMIFIAVNTPTKTTGKGAGMASRFKICN